MHPLPLLIGNIGSGRGPGGCKLIPTRNLGFTPVGHWQPVGGGVHIRGKWCEPFQLPRVIEGGVWINDSREFELHPEWHWQPGGGGLYPG